MKRTYALAIPSEADLTAPVLASTELSKLFIEITDHYDLLLRQTRIINGMNDEGKPVVTIIDHPDLKVWAKLRIECLTKIQALSQNLEQNKMDNKLKALNILLENKDKLDPTIKEQFIRLQLEEEAKRAVTTK
jgi:hypothetical protein